MNNLSPNFRTALLMMLSMAAFTVNDTFMKLAASHVPFYQSIIVRGCIITVGLVIMGLALGQLRFKFARRDKTLIIWRTIAEIAGTIFFLTALIEMPIANLSAILQALPLTVTLAAALFFREAVGWRRMVAILIGFIGVLLIVQPGTEGFTASSVYAILAVIAVTFRDLAARRLSTNVPSVLVALAASIGVTAYAAIVGYAEPWADLTSVSGFQLGSASLCLMVGYVASVAAMRGGDIGFVAPFRYTGLVVALILGFLVFGDWPDGLTMLGAGIVVATGLFTLYRERKTSRAAPLGVRIR